MRSFTGLLLLAAGVTIGAYAYYPDTVEQHVHLARVTRILTPVTAAQRTEPADTARTFSPAAGMFDDGSPIETASLGSRGAAPEVVDAKPALVSPSGWSTVVHQAPAYAGRDVGMRSTQPAGAAARYELARDIQRELKRVGCYSNEITGSWGVGSKRAMAGFLRQVNASLPFEEPDYILLALVRSQKSQVCGIAGTEMIAETSPPSGPPVAAAPLAAPRLVRDATRTAGADGTAGSASLTDRIAVTRRPAEPLPGRMAVGAPPPPPDLVKPPQPLTRSAPVEGPAADRVYGRTEPPAFSAPPPRREVRPNPPKRVVVRETSRRSKAARQRALMRQAFGDNFAF